MGQQGSEHYVAGIVCAEDPGMQWLQGGKLLQTIAVLVVAEAVLGTLGTAAA
jgi:hypothetical protein